MRTKTKICCKCGKDKLIWKTFKGEKYCKFCWQKHKPPKQPKSVSPKKVSVHKLYSQIRKEFLSLPGNNCCQHPLTPECTRSHTDYLTIHHTKGRGKYYLDVSTFVVLCLSCHRHVHDKLTAEEARSLGLKR